jgi:hypothetical protein
MNLREQAEKDLAITLEDNATGFGWPIKIIDPHFNVADIFGQSTDIGLVIDAETGSVVSGRQATVSIRISSLTQHNLGLPKGISDPSKKPWIIEFTDINGKSFTFKVVQTQPDRTLGVVTCTLEAYRC